MKRHKQRLQRQNTLVGTSLAPSAAAGLLPYPSNMASLKSKMAAAAGDDVVKSRVPGCVSDDALYANGHLTATLDRQVRLNFLSFTSTGRLGGVPPLLRRHHLPSSYVLSAVPSPRDPL